MYYLSSLCTTSFPPYLSLSLYSSFLPLVDISRASSIGDTVSVLRLINSPAPSDSAEGTANGLLQHIAKVLAGNAQVEFRIPQVNHILYSTTTTTTLGVNNFNFFCIENHSATFRFCCFNSATRNAALLSI